VFTDWRVWALALADFSRGVFNNALNFWMPTLVRSSAWPRTITSSSPADDDPVGTAALAMVLCAWNSDRTGDRLWHAVLTALAPSWGC
jgi:hypothetical protein